MLVELRVRDLAVIADARLELGPGLNVLCAPNEFGKSTLFDALQALSPTAYARCRPSAFQNRKLMMRTPSFILAMRLSGSAGACQSSLDTFLPLRCRSKRRISSSVGFAIPCSAGG